MSVVQIDTWFKEHGEDFPMLCPVEGCDREFFSTKAARSHLSDIHNVREQLDAPRPPRADRSAERGPSGSEVRVRVPPPAPFETTTVGILAAREAEASIALDGETQSEPPSHELEENEMGDTCTKVEGCVRLPGHTGRHKVRAPGGGPVATPEPTAKPGSSRNSRNPGKRRAAASRLKVHRARPALPTANGFIAHGDELATAALELLRLFEAPMHGGSTPFAEEYDVARWRLGAAAAVWKAARNDG